MLDSLDLEDLRRQVEEAKKADAAFYPVVAKVIGVLGLMFLLALLGTISGKPGALLERLSYLFIPLCPVIFIIMAIAIFLYRASQRNIASRHRANQYKPSFVSSLEIQIEWRNYLIWFVSVSLIGIALGLHFLIILVLVLVPKLPYLLISVLPYWLSKQPHQKRIAYTKTLLHWFPNDKNLLNLRAISLAIIGDLAEAETIHRQLLSNKSYLKTSFDISHFLGALGSILSVERRWDEAVPILEAAIRIIPDFGIPYVSLAEIYLEQALEYERALQLIEIGIEYNRKTYMSVAEPFALKARTLALLGQNTQVNEALDEAFQAMKVLTPSSTAEIYRQAGYTRRAQGDENAAREFFTKAVELDPDGLYGKLAQKALDSTSSN